MASLTLVLKHLLGCMLQPDPAKCFAAQQLLKQHWLNA